MLSNVAGVAAVKKHAAAPQKKSGAATPTSRSGVRGGRAAASSRGTHVKTKAIPSPVTQKSAALHSAFVASSSLRAMAQQLSATRSAAAYSGVASYAASHTGEAASAAWLAIGHARSADRQWSEAVAAYRQAAQQGSALRDYADYLAAQAALQSHDAGTAVSLLTNFGAKHPGSIFTPNAPVALANAYLQNSDGGSALVALRAPGAASQSADALYTEGRARLATGDTNGAADLFRRIYVRLPFSPEAGQAKQQLMTMGAGPSAGERKLHADALFNAKRYGEAADEYYAIAKNDSSLTQSDRDALAIYMAVCDLRLKHLSRGDAGRLPDTNDDSAALKMYILAEISRTEGDVAGHGAILQSMEQRFPKSRWLEEALFSGGNMYLIKRNSTEAIAHYSKLVQYFPNSTYAPQAHWRTAWLNYRMRNYPEAARLMDEQVTMFPNSAEAPTALYWRGRLYEDVERNPAQAVNYYNALTNTYRNYYYANQARVRLAGIGQMLMATPPAPALASVRAPSEATLVAALPENDEHLIKARLLANASLNEYIAPEIRASGTSSQWGALAEAEIYTSYGEDVRALQAIKRSGVSFYTLPIREVPVEYWNLLFPRPYWGSLTSAAEAQSVDPYLVASLIRQESEFNPGAVSRANAYGLMQLLPSVGKAQAKRLGIKKFSTATLLNPDANLRMGTANLRQVLDRFGGQVEYALAAYNAGDVPIRNWMAENNYKDIAEFVESIPYTETRDYVQSIQRNREMYRQLYSGR